MDDPVAMLNKIERVLKTKEGLGLSDVKRSWFVVLVGESKHPQWWRPWH